MSVRRALDVTTCVEKADLVEKLTQAPSAPAVPAAPLVVLKFLEGNWTPTEPEQGFSCDRTAGLLMLSAPQDAVEQANPHQHTHRYAIGSRARRGRRGGRCA